MNKNKFKIQYIYIYNFNFIKFKQDVAQFSIFFIYKHQA